MDTIPEGLDIPQDGSGDHQPSGVLAEARVKLAAALRAFSVAQAAVPGLQAALAAGYPLPRDDLVELDRVRSAMADAAHALGLDPDRATLAEMEARLAEERGRLDTARTDLDATQKARRQHEQTVQDLEAKRSKYKGQLMDVKTDRKSVV